MLFAQGGCATRLRYAPTPKTPILLRFPTTLAHSLPGQMYQNCTKTRTLSQNSCHYLVPHVALASNVQRCATNKRVRRVLRNNSLAASGAVGSGDVVAFAKTVEPTGTRPMGSPAAAPHRRTRLHAARI